MPPPERTAVAARAAVLVVLVVLVMPEVAAWTQLGGGADRTGVASLQPGPLDVHAVLQLFEPGRESHKFHGSPFAMTPHGLLGVHRDAQGGDCILSLLDVDTGARSDRPLPDCRRGWFHGYDPALDRFYLCNIGRTATASLQARDARTGEVVWSLTPVDLGALAPAGADAPDDLNWMCSDVAIEADALAVTFVASRSGVDFPTHRVARVASADGSVLWSRVVPTVALLGPDAPPVPQPALGFGDGTGPDFLPLSVTATSTGYLVPGLFFCTGEVVCEEPTSPGAFPYTFALAWLARDGTVNGMILAQDPQADRSEAARNTGGSLWASASAGIGALAIGSRIVRVDPLRGVINSGDLHESQAFVPGYAAWSGSAWSAETGTIYVPLDRALAAFDDEGLTPSWSWDVPEATWRLANVAASRSGEVLVLGSHFVPWEGTDPDATQPGDPAVDAQRLYRFGEDRSLLQWLPLPIRHDYVSMPEIALPGAGPLALWFHESAFVFVDVERFLVVAHSGDAVLLGPARPDGAPRVEVSSRYPEPGDEVAFTFQPPSGLDAIIVQWDAGAAPVEQKVDDVSVPITWRHTFAQAQREMVTMTFVYDDGHTATRTFVVEVGGTAPSELNFMQKAFSDRYEDTTWGIIGLAVAATGAVFGFLFHLRRRTRLQKELAVLDAIRSKSLEDPIGTLSELEAFRRRIHASLRRGRLTDGEYGLLSLRMGAVAERVRAVLLVPLAPRLSAAFRDDLEAAFADGLVDAREEAHLRSRLAAERRLSAEDRSQLERILDVWRPSGAGGR